MYGPVGLFGKIPAQGDFFRFNVADPGVQGLVSWLQEAIEPVYRGALRLPSSPVRFLFRTPGAPSVVIGAMSASVDKVGRHFPLCLFVSVPAGDVAARYPAVPGAFRPFLDDAVALLAEASGMDGAALTARVRALPGPASAALGVAEATLRREASEARGGELSHRLFGDLPPGAIAYALGTLEAAAKPVRGREPARAAISLDCPAEQDLDRWAWLELARRSLAWPAPPSFFWMEGTGGRIVLALGGAPGGLLAHLCDPARPGPKVWPLRTAQSTAIESARKALPPSARLALDDPNSTLGGLVASTAA